MVKFLNWPEEYRGTKTGVGDVLAAGRATIEEIHRWAKDAPDLDALPVGISMADIEPEAVTWLWKRRIPKGKVTILDGDPGKGKSLILYDLSARITSGQPLPDGEPIERGAVIIVSAEDGAADTIAPRFLAAGGDPTRARIIGSEKPFIIPDDLDRLDRAIKQTAATFVVIDPVMSFLSDDINSNRDQDVRRALQPLVDIAARTGVAVVICRHLNKSSGGSALYRGQGSIGFIGIVRSGLMVGDHPDREGVHVLAGQKSNLSRPPESIAYRITNAGPGDETAIIEYLGKTEVTAQQMNTTPDDEGERDRLAEAKEFLRNILRAGPAPTRGIKKEATDADIAWRTVERAKGHLKADAYKDGETGRWMWTLEKPAEEAEEMRGASVRRSRVGGDGGLGDLEGASGSPPSVAEMADNDSPLTTTTKNKAYIREDRQPRQPRQEESGDRRTDDETNSANNSAEHGGLGGASAETRCDSERARSWVEA